MRSGQIGKLRSGTDRCIIMDERIGLGTYSRAVLTLLANFVQYLSFNGLLLQGSMRSLLEMLAHHYGGVVKSAAWMGSSTSSTTR
jgi:hypothetical protein